MKRPDPILRCSCPGCTIAPGPRILAILVVCIAIATGCIILVDDYKAVHGKEEKLTATRDGTSRVGYREFSSERSSEFVRTRAYRRGGNSETSESKNDLPLAPCVSRSGFNAALAAGLIDPSRMELAKPLNPGLEAVREQTISLIGPVSGFWNPLPNLDSEIALTTVPVATPTPTADNPLKSTDALSSLSGAMGGMGSSPARQSDGSGLDRRPPSSGPSKSARPKNKPLPVRLTAVAGINSAENAS